MVYSTGSPDTTGISLGILACLTLHIYSIYDSYKSIKKITNGESVEDIMFFNNFM